MSCTQDIGVVAPGMPRSREIQTSRMRDGVSGQDARTAGKPAAPHSRGIQNLNVNEHDPFVRISLHDKVAVVHCLIVNHKIDILALRDTYDCTPSTCVCKTVR